MATETKGKKAPKKGKKVKATNGKPRDPDKLAPTQVTILEILARSKAPLARGQLMERLDISRGFSKLMGAVTKDDFGGGAETGLLARGFVKAQVAPEGERGSRYTITATGRKALEKAQAEAKVKAKK